MEIVKSCVDVAINVYGKPYQTAVTLYSLLKHSGQWIDKIYFIEEAKQPEASNFQFIFNKLGKKVIHYKPKFWLWTNAVKFHFFLKFGPYRRAIRYQYGWEKTNKKYLLVLHNDVYFTGDLVYQYLKNIGSNSGIGKIGQCWNCPAFTAQLCDGDRYAHYKPNYKEVIELSDKFPGARSESYKNVLSRKQPWPLPECRLNEYVALVNLEVAKPATLPEGKATPIGASNRLDIGVEWFSQLTNLGHTFANFNYDPFAIHSWVSLRNTGHEALFNKNLYKYEESIALQVLKDEFNYHPEYQDSSA